MPRGDGLKPGTPRTRTRVPSKTYVPTKLRRRLFDFEEDQRTPDAEHMATKPGSQNPRKRGPKRARGV